MNPNPGEINFTKETGDEPFYFVFGLLVGGLFMLLICLILLTSKLNVTMEKIFMMDEAKYQCKQIEYKTWVKA